MLRKVANGPRDWPDEATSLSYPDWIIDRLDTDLGAERARFALESMNERATVGGAGRRLPPGPGLAVGGRAEVGRRGGGAGARPVRRPGGKATALLASGAIVVAADLRPARVGLIVANAARLGGGALVALAADGRHPPFRPACFDRVLVDAPCSGLGSLRRRPDARWRIQPDDVEALAALQRELLDAAAALVRPGGTLVYSVCTLTAAETIGVDEWLAEAPSRARGRACPRGRRGSRTGAAGCCCPSAAMPPPAPPTACSSSASPAADAPHGSGVPGPPGGVPGTPEREGA